MGSTAETSGRLAVSDVMSLEWETHLACSREPESSVMIGRRIREARGRGGTCGCTRAACGPIRTNICGIELKDKLLSSRCLARQTNNHMAKKYRLSDTGFGLYYMTTERGGKCIQKAM